MTDENLLLFLLSLAASLAIHFYVTMMAFFLCVVIAACRLPALFQKRRFVSLVKAVCLGVLIAVLPMGIDDRERGDDRSGGAADGTIPRGERADTGWRECGCGTK